MLFLISLVIAACFVYFCGGTLRKHPAPFYIAAAILSIGAVCVIQLHPQGIPTWVNQYVLWQLTKGTLATAFWAIVMWTGALPNSFSLMKKLMPPRGQLSIFAAILTLGHAAGYGISYFPRWLQKADYWDFAVCAALILIMLPLTVLSVRKIRKKLKPTKWKAIQRFAYLFYILIPVHVILVSYKQAKAGRSGSFFSLMVYLIVFLGYAVCRLRKWYLTAKKPEKRMLMNTAACVGFLIPLIGIALMLQPQPAPETRQTNAVDIAEASPADTTVSTEATTDAAETTETETVTETSVNTDTTDETETAETSDSTETTEPEEEESESEDEAEEQLIEEESVEEPIPEEEPIIEEIPHIYQDGTFTGIAFGYDGNIIVYVTIQDDNIIELNAETEESDESYFIDAKRVVFPAIMDTQSPIVDACSGATLSSEAIMKAVQAALDSARL